MTHATERAGSVVYRPGMGADRVRIVEDALDSAIADA
ncbi:MAG: hypothetical protein RLZZ272_781, partial [Actinomycetota bacterium]